MANFRVGGTILRPVRTLTEADLDKDTARGRNTWKAMRPKDRQHLLALIGLRRAIETKDELMVKKLAEAYRRLGRHMGRVTAVTFEDLFGDEPSIQKDMAGWAKERSQEGLSFGRPQRALAQLLTEAIRRARLVLWWHDRERRFLPALYCPDLTTALYVRALIGIVGGRTLLVCPRCGEPFVQPRSDQNYCSIRCREAHRVARFRARQTGTKRRERRKP